jgi:nitroimidazol reductase NimA-like FMN-containing flavoprotein (pyridoxamine 5'-phosphate oxidase superfamily)
MKKDKTKEIRRDLKALLSSQNLATLATHQDGQPYTSLVAFAVSDDLKYIIFATPTTTRKYFNLSSDSRVALLVNSSQNQVSDFHRAMAVTATGEASEISGSSKNKFLKSYLLKHPHLEDFVKSPTCALVGVTVKSYYLVKNFQHVMELHIAE